MPAVYRKGINFNGAPDGAKALEYYEKGRSITDNIFNQGSAYASTFWIGECVTKAIYYSVCQVYSLLL